MSLLTFRRYNARSHAVLAVDIVGSSQASDDLLDPMKSEMEQLVSRALELVALNARDARHVRETGDGLMVAYPEIAVVQVVEFVFYLDHFLRSRNRYARAPMRGRVAVHIGPMSDERRYHRTYITLTRLLNSSRFGDAVANVCQRDTDGEKFGAALVISRDIWRQVVEPFHAALVPPARCAEINVETPDFSDSAWIYFPGLDAQTTLAQFAYRSGEYVLEDRGPNGARTRSTGRVPGAEIHD